MGKNENNILQKLEEASKPLDHFTLKLEFNGELVAKKDFMADKFAPETIKDASLHFLVVDASRNIQKELRKLDDKIKEVRNSLEIRRLRHGNDGKAPSNLES